MRMGDGGFISTVDTIAALEALVTYSYNNRINDITELNVEVELPDSNITENVEVTGKTALGISRLRTIKIPNVWGTMKFHATGAGQAVVQLDTNYGIDYEPNKDIPPKVSPSCNFYCNIIVDLVFQDCFNLTIDEYPDIRSRNKSEIIVKSCFAWLCTDESPVSGMAMLEVISSYK